MVWYGTIWYSMVRYGMVRYRMVWYIMVRYGTVRYGTVRYVTVWYGMEDPGDLAAGVTGETGQSGLTTQLLLWLHSTYTCSTVPALLYLLYCTCWQSITSITSTRGNKCTVHAVKIRNTEPTIDLLQWNNCKCLNLIYFNYFLKTFCLNQNFKE